MKILLQLLFKHLLRNKSIFLTNIMIPVVLYPMMYWGLQQFFIVYKGFSENQKYVVFLDTDSNFSDLKDSLSSNVKCTFTEKTDSAVLSIYVSKNKSDLPQYKIMVDSTSSLSLSCRGKVFPVLRSYFQEKLKHKKNEYNYADDYFEGFFIKKVNIDDRDEIFMRLLSILIPVFSIISILGGSSAAAIEINAGEKESKISETICTLPIPRIKILYAKILTSMLFGLISGILNFIILIVIYIQSLRLIFLKMNIIRDLNINIDFLMSFKIVVLILISLSIISFVGALIFTAFTSFAKTRKEANIMLSPVISVLMFSSFIVAIPALDSELFMAFIPVINISMSLKMLIIGTLEFKFIIITIISSSIYIITLLKILIPILETEDVILGISNTTLLKRIKSIWKK